MPANLTAGVAGSVKCGGGQICPHCNKPRAPPGVSRRGAAPRLVKPKEEPADEDWFPLPVSVKQEFVIPTEEFEPGDVHWAPSTELLVPKKEGEDRSVGQGKKSVKLEPEEAPCTAERPSKAAVLSRTSKAAVLPRPSRLGSGKRKGSAAGTTTGAKKQKLGAGVAAKPSKSVGKTRVKDSQKGKGAAKRIGKQIVEASKRVVHARHHVGARKYVDAEYQTEQFISQRGPVTQAQIKQAMDAAQAFRTEFPSAILKMMPSNVYRGFWLNMPRALFTKLPKKNAKLCLVDEMGREQPVMYLAERHAPGISGGWRAFALNRSLEEHDVCVFELVDAKKLVFRVHIFRVLPVESGNQLGCRHLRLRSGSKEAQLPDQRLFTCQQQRFSRTPPCKTSGL